MYVLKSQIWAYHFNIELNQAPLTSNKSQRLKLYSMFTCINRFNFSLFWVSPLDTLLLISAPLRHSCNYSEFKINLQISVKALSKIYNVFTDPGSLGEVERLLRRFRKLHVPNVRRKTVKNYLKCEQAYALHMPARRWFFKNHIVLARSLLTGRLTWTICNISPNKTMKWGILLL